MTVHSSYVSTKFLKLYRFPLIPLGRVHVHNQCCQCGLRGVSSLRRFKKLRAGELASMMDGFLANAENPDAALHGLRTLMIYNEETWFLDLVNMYGRRFYDHMQVQLMIAEGLFRFGRYEDAELYCRQAIVLGARKQAENLLSMCQSMHDKGAPVGLRPQSMIRPYAFLFSVSAVAGAVFGILWIASVQNYSAWLINGLPLQYAVEIDGTRHLLRPNSCKKIVLRLGEHKLKLPDRLGRATPVIFTSQVSMLKQRFSGQTLVLNPDAAAVLVEEIRQAGQISNQFHFGQYVYVFEKIDRPFADFSNWSGGNQDSLVRLYSHRDDGALERIAFLREIGLAASAPLYARRILNVDPSIEGARELLHVAVTGLDADQTINFLRHGMQRRPLSGVWHLFYQQYMETVRPEYDLQSEYAALCEQNPEDPESYYLLALVTHNPDIALRFFEKSEENGGVQGRGYYAAALRCFYAGRFSQALDYSDKALAAAPRKSDFEALSVQVHLALQEYEVPLRAAREKIGQHPKDREARADEIKYLTLMGRHQEALDALNREASSEDGTVEYMRAARFYVSGNSGDYLEQLERSGYARAGFEKLLHAGKVKAARESLAGIEDAGFEDHLILYLAAVYNRYPEIAEEELRAASALIGTSTHTERKLADLLDEASPMPPVDEVLDLQLMPDEKRVLCAVLGCRYPEGRSLFFGLARKYNYSPTYPYLLLKKWTR